MDHRERDMLKMNGIVELLIEENKYLREHISSKNRYINNNLVCLIKQIEILTRFLRQLA